MKTIKSFVGVLLTIALISCKDSAVTDTGDDNLVSGKLLVDGKPIVAASVQIDDVLNWKTTTDSSGQFEIHYVTIG